MGPFLGADESAVFTNYASQQKKQLQGVFQRLICLLLLQTLSLLKQELPNPNAAKVARLKVTLAKLLKLAAARRVLLPKPVIRIMNTYKGRAGGSSRVSSASLALLLSVVVRAVDMKRCRE
jgi:hypothetical protein